MESTLPLIYGPIQSRRHGLSLGVNLGAPNDKTCSWSCLYCQCGFGKTAPTLPLTLDISTVLQEIKTALKLNPNIECITFAGNTEPGLYPKFDELIRKLKLLRNSAHTNWKIKILSNGSEVNHEQVLRAYRAADETWLKLDCALPELFLKTNRPVSGTLADHLLHLSKILNPRIQTMLWSCPTKPHLANDSSENWQELIRQYHLLKPTEIHLYTIARTPAFSELQPLPYERLKILNAELNHLGFISHCFSGYEHH